MLGGHYDDGIKPVDPESCPGISSPLETIP